MSGTWSGQPRQVLDWTAKAMWCGKTWSSAERREIDIRKIAFIHIPKTAGLAVRQSLGLAYSRHVPLCALRVLYPRTLRAAVSFCVMRDPIDRFISAFWFLKNGGKNNSDEVWAAANLGNYSQPNDLCQKLMSDARSRERILFHTHFRPQRFWISNFFGKVQVDSVLRFEYLNDDLLWLSSVLKLSEPSLDVVNQTTTRKDEREAYSSVYQFCYQYYACDYAVLKHTSFPMRD